MQEHETDSDALLMMRVADGDRNALCSLMDKWESPLLGFIYRYVQNREAAAELTQETFVRLYEARARYRGDMRFSPWIFRIAANLCRNYHRWRKRHPEDMAWDEACEATNAPQQGTVREEDDPAAILARRESLSELKNAIAAMPHDLATTLLLYYYQELSYREIAEVIGCSERGVETRLYRARTWLSKELAQPAQSRPGCGILAAGGML
jgi:RNA polymerase sigma-70 factor (ECF subfamily)